MEGLTNWLKQLNFNGVLDVVLIVAASLLCIIVHETCHGLAAYWMGDDTAKRAGRLSLNPMKHIDIMGLIMMALFRFGWAKPVPVDMRKFQKPKLGMAITALAGPVSNILLVLVAAVLRLFAIFFSLKYEIAFLEYIVLFFEYIMILSAGLAIFNLIPVPPLDGSKILFSLLSNRMYMALMKYERFGMLLLMALLITNVIDTPLLYMRGWVLDLAANLTVPLAELLQRLL